MCLSLSWAQWDEQEKKNVYAFVGLQSSRVRRINNQIVRCTILQVKRRQVMALILVYIGSYCNSYSGFLYYCNCFDYYTYWKMPKLKTFFFFFRYSTISTLKKIELQLGLKNVDRGTQSQELSLTLLASWLCYPNCTLALPFDEGYEILFSWSTLKNNYSKTRRKTLVEQLRLTPPRQSAGATKAGS